MRLRSVIILGAAGLLASWVVDEMKRAGGGSRGRGNRARLSEPEREDHLTAAIENTFPASDPYQVSSPTSQEADRPIHRRPAVIDPASIARQVELLERKRGERN